MGPTIFCIKNNKMCFKMLSVFIFRHSIIIIYSRLFYMIFNKFVFQCFLIPLHGLTLIPEHVIVTIFSNIEQIKSVNQELVRHLQNMGIGQSFLKLAPFLKLYSTYANNHERALAALLVCIIRVRSLALTVPFCQTHNNC